LLNGECEGCADRLCFRQRKGEDLAANLHLRQASARLTENTGFDCLSSRLRQRTKASAGLSQ
jgi:hypothetical protein